MLEAALPKPRGNLSRGPQNFFIFCLVLRSEEVLVVRSEEMVVLRSVETIVVVGRPIGRDLGGPPIGSRFKSEPVWPL